MIKCGFIGMGKIGRTRAREIEMNEDTEAAAYYDIEDVDAPECGTRCGSVEELLDQDIHAVFICAYNNVAAEYSIRALEAGKHVFCEKPPARTSTELEAVIEAEEKTNLILKYGFNHRYHYSVMEAMRMVENEIFGRLLWVRGIYGKAGGNQFARNWRNNIELSGGGILLDQGIHMLDLMMLFAGDFTEIQSIVQTQYWEVPVEDNAFVIMKTEDNVAAMLHSSATQWRHRFVLDMCFEDGNLNLEGILSSTRSYGDETLVVERRQFEDTTFALGKPREERIYFDTDDSWKLELNEFVDAIKNKRKVKNGRSADALKVMRLIERIYDKSGYYK